MSFFNKQLMWSVSLFMLIALSGCVKDEFDSPGNNGCTDEQLQRNMTIADLKALYGGTTLQIEQDFIIEGVVISNDEAGNFYKQLIIQDETAGILLLIDQNNLYANFPPGRKVYVKAQDMYMSDYGGTIQLGASIEAETGDLERIPQSMINEFIFKGPCNQPVDTVKLPVSQLDPDVHQSMLVKFESMKMEGNDAGIPYAEVGGSSSQNRTMLDCNNGSIILRTSDFVNFAGELTPTGRFSITGVYSVFNGDKQLAIRTIDDVVENGAECPCEEVQGSVNGTTSFQLDNIQVLDDQQTQLIDEDFSSVSDGSVVSISNWENIAESGTQRWEGDSFNSEKYIRASAYQTGESDVRIWLVTPSINIQGQGESLTFQTKDAFDDGAVLEVLVSTDYDGGGQPWNFTWEKVCPSISGGHPNGFAPDWEPSGLTDISGFTGNAYIAFRYKGGE